MPYLSVVALERDSGDGHSDTGHFRRTRMLPFDSYRDVLSEHIQGRHVVASAWILVVAVSVLLVMFA